MLDDILNVSLIFGLKQVIEWLFFHIMRRAIFCYIILICHCLNIINLTKSPHSSTTLTQVLPTISSLCKQLNYLAFGTGLRWPSSLPFPTGAWEIALTGWHSSLCLTQWHSLTRSGNYCFAVLHKMRGSSQKACCPETVRCDCSVSGKGMKWADGECDARPHHLLHPMSGFWLRSEK